MAAGVHHAYHRDGIAGLKPGYSGANTEHTTDDLVTGHYRIMGIVPVIASLVQVGMTDTALVNIDHHIIAARFTPLEPERRQVVVRSVGCIAKYVHVRFSG